MYCIDLNKGLPNDYQWGVLYLWDEREFLDKTKDSPIHRIGYERWLRNIAIALGNSAATNENIQALQLRLNYPSTLVQEHVKWAYETLLKPR